MRSFALVLVLGLLLLPSCRYNFMPLIPPVAAVNIPPHIQASLTRDGEKLLLKVNIAGDFKGGYLSVNWFDGSSALGQDSVYLDATERSASLSLAAAEAGAYRAVLSLDGQVLRQLELYEVQP